MKSYLPSLLAAALAMPIASAETLLFLDNFDVADTTNFDAAPLTGRRTGTLAADIFMRSALVQQHINGNQFRFAGSGRARIQNAGGWYNWASTSGPAILADGGMRVSFDWTPLNTTSTNWVSFDVGFATGAEPGTRVNNAETDFGMLFRNNGATERFDNGVNKGAGGSFPAVATNRHVVIDYAFSSFADTTTVKVRASVNGVVTSTSTVSGVVLPYETFTWANNSGALYMELGSNEAGHKIDNFTVSTIPVDYSVTTSATKFISGLAPDGLVANLIGETFAKGPEASTFTLVAGAGDTDNSRFKINGSRLEPNSSFTSDPNGAVYHIRVQGTGTVSGGTQTKELTLTLFNDDDADTLLDDWEENFAGNLTDLNGLGDGTGTGAGTGDFDEDGILDSQEYQYSLGLYPDINPVLKDTDGDGLFDKDEIDGADFRPPTLPTVADSDKDGLNDFVENSFGVYTDEEDTGSNPRDPDSDLDGSRDGFEVERGSDPNDAASRPALPAEFAVVQVTDDESTGIATSKYYTHAISGGGAATINGVTLAALDGGANVPPNFNWTVSTGAKGWIVPVNNGDWVPATGNVTGAGLLQMLGGFTYAANGDAGVVQTYTLNGLVVGEEYELKLFIRVWDTEGSGRPNDLKFINGESTVMPFGALPEDRPGIVLNNANNHSAYYLRYTYTAQDTQLVIQAGPHISAAAASGSYHLYGLTNEGLSGAPAELKVTAISRSPGGDVTIDFSGAPSTQYELTQSPDLVTAFASFAPPVMVTTNGSGTGQVVLPAAQAPAPQTFYRIED